MSEVPPEEELAEIEAEKDNQVMEREGLEQELMQQDASEVGEEIDGVDVSVQGGDRDA
jgi:hypothetical protein